MTTKFQVLKTIFSTFCLLAAFGCVIWCAHIYRLDLDLSLVSRKNFGDSENFITPSMSLCFYDPFLKHKFSEEKLGMNVSHIEYKNFLFARKWDRRLLKIDFENVTTKIDDYLLGYSVLWKNTSYSKYNTAFLPNLLKKPYPSYIGPFGKRIVKCYAVNIPINATLIVLNIKNGVFPGRVRPKLWGFGVSFHYPNQFHTSLDNMRYTWPNHHKTENTSLFMLMKLNTFEVTIRRNSRRQSCNPNWREYESNITEKTYSYIGCRPVYNVLNSSLSPCNSRRKMSVVTSIFTGMDWKGNKYLKPCQSADKIVYEYQETYPKSSKDNFWIAAQMPISGFKLTEQKQAYDLQNLIGNSGGYIGLILGKLFLGW